MTLNGRRVLVVGATSGIGRSVAQDAIDAGARVVVTGRRSERLAELASGGRDVASVCADIRQPEDCARLAAEAASALGEIDLVFFAAGASMLNWIEDTTAEDWALAMQTNVIGVNLVISALLPHLAPRAVVAACSSESVGHPHAGLVSYGASKAALEESLRGWRAEHPEVRFTCVAVGATYPTEFGLGFDPERLASAMELWTRHGHTQEELMATDDVAETLVATFETLLAHPGVGFEQLVVRSPSGVTSAVEGIAEVAEINRTSAAT